MLAKGVFKGGVQGVQTPLPENFRFFWKSKGKEIERKRKEKDVGGEWVLPLKILLGLRYFQGGLRNFQVVEKFSGVVEKFSW